MVNLINYLIYVVYNTRMATEFRLYNMWMMITHTHTHTHTHIYIYIYSYSLNCQVLKHVPLKFNGNLI